MKITYTGTNMDITDEIRELTQSHLDKLDKYFDEEVSCNVTFTKRKDVIISEITISLPGAFIRSEESSADLRSSLDRAVEVLSRQIRKYKTRLQKRYIGKDTIRYENIPEWTPEESVDTDSNEGKIVRTKTFDLRPMSEDEAILQLELLGHNFFVFNNAYTNVVNVIYKRKDGGYGLLQPQH